MLLDTHAFLWWLAGDAKLSGCARDAIADKANPIYVSAASTWEIAMKVRIGKLAGAATVAGSMPDIIELCGFLPLAISVEHADRAGLLPGPHRDLFDRMLIAQAQAGPLTVVTNDPVFSAYGVRTLW